MSMLIDIFISKLNNKILKHNNYTMSWKIQGKNFIPQQAVQTTDILPKGTYYIRYDERLGFYLEQVEDFKLPEKLYGDTSIVDHWLTSYNITPRNTGIILTGIKGSGKTLLSKKCAIDSGLPVIIIDNPYSDDEFISFITNPELGNVCIFIDEFEKVYSKSNDAHSLLSILDGAFNTHNLFIFTCNSMYDNEYLINRPSRIKYRIHFESLPDDTINEVINDLLIYPEYSEEIRKVLLEINIVTFDLLITLINETNIFRKSPILLSKNLNIQKELVYVNILEIWKGTPYFMDKNELYNNNPYLCVIRNFDAIDDPEYCDEDECDNGGLPEYVYIPQSEIVPIASDTWEYKGKLGHFIFERNKYKHIL